MGGGCWIPGSALPACQLGALPPLLNVSDDVSCPSQLFPLGTGQQGLFYTHSQQLGWLGTGLLPELCQVGSVAVLPSQLLSEPTLSSVLAGSGAHLAGLSFQRGSPRAGQESRVCLEGKNPPDHPLLGRAEQGPFCPALGTSPPTLSCPSAALTRGKECDRDFMWGGMSHRKGEPRRDVRIPCALCPPDIRVPGSAVTLSPCGHHPGASCSSWMKPVPSLGQGWHTSPSSWMPLRVRDKPKHPFFFPPGMKAWSRGRAQSFRSLPAAPSGS